MASVLKVDKLDPQSGTALEIGTSGDTISVPSGATLDISSATLTPPATMPASSAANLTNIPGANITGTIAAVSGANLTSLNATNLGSGTVPTARLGTGTASSSTILYGDNTWAAAGGGGKLLSVDSRFTSSASTHSTTSYTASNIYGTITPTAASSKIFVSVTFGGHSYKNGTTATNFFSRIYRDIAGGGYTSEFPDTTSYTTGYTEAAVTKERADYGTFTFTFLDSPSYTLTDEITYKLYARQGATDTGYIEATEACFTMMEIGA